MCTAWQCTFVVHTYSIQPIFQHFGTGETNWRENTRTNARWRSALDSARAQQSRQVTRVVRMRQPFSFAPSLLFKTTAGDGLEKRREFNALSPHYHNQKGLEAIFWFAAAR